MSAGDDSLPTAQREVEEELGLQLPQEVSRATAMCSGLHLRWGTVCDQQNTWTQVLQAMCG